MLRQYFDRHVSYNSDECKRIIKRGTHVDFNAIRVLKKNVSTFCLHKVLIKCRVSTRKSYLWFSIDSSVQQTEYYEKKVPTLRIFYF